MEHVSALHKEGIPFQFDSLLGAFLSKLEPHPELGVTAEETLEKEKLKLKTGLVGLVLPTGAIATPLVNPAFTPEERGTASVVRQGDVAAQHGKELAVSAWIRSPDLPDPETQGVQDPLELRSQPPRTEEVESRWIQQAELSEEFQAPQTVAVRPKTTEPPLQDQETHAQAPSSNGGATAIVAQGRPLVERSYQERAKRLEPASLTWPEATTAEANFEFPRNLSLRLMAKARAITHEVPSQSRFSLSQEDALGLLPSGGVSGIASQPDAKTELVELWQELDRGTKQMARAGQGVAPLQRPTATNQEGKPVTGEVDVPNIAEPRVDEPMTDAEAEAPVQSEARSQTNEVEVTLRPKTRGDVGGQGQRKGLSQPADIPARSVVFTTPLPESNEVHESEQGGRTALDLHDQEAFFPKLVQNIQSVVQGERTEVRIQLKPDHLGELKIKLSLEQGIMKAEFVVENETVREVLASNLPQLHTALQDQGNQVAELMVNIGFGQNDQNEQGQARPRKLNNQVKQGFEESTTINDGNETYLGRTRWNQVDVKA